MIDPRAEELYFLTPYNYVANTPIIAIDPDGEFPVFLTAVIGAVVGSAVEYGKQVVSNVREGGFNKDAFTNVDGKAIAGAATKGLISGVIVGLTGGSSTLIAPLLAQGAGGVVGGIADRAIKGENLLNAGEIVSDFASGAIGGALGFYANKSLAGRTTTTILTKNAVKYGPSVVRALGKAVGKETKRLFPDAPKPPSVGIVKPSDFNK